MIQIVTPSQTAVDSVLPPIEEVPATPRMAEPGARKKLAPYCKQLFMNRYGGFHPERVRLIFGDNWRVASETKKRETEARAHGVDPYSRVWIKHCGDPVVALRPADFEREAFDWRPLVDVLVDLVDQTGSGGDANAALYWLGAEVARWAADVNLVFGDGGQGDQIHIRGAAFCFKSYVEVKKKMTWRWPAWWSDELEKLNVERSGKWYEAATRRYRAAIEREKTG